MAIVTGDRYLEKLVKFVEAQAGPLIEGTLVLKLNPAGLHYVQSRLESLHELERLLAGAPVDYLRAYVSDLGDHRALEQLRRILRLLTSLKVVSVLPQPTRDPTPLCLLPFGRLRFLELRGCDLSTSAARGLLELRHTLEKLICHNSTDALRHIFASRIADIKKSPQWNRLSFVSCACNSLVLMDESLQLLPAVETLDLSQNRFSKVDNLRKCAKLKQLDLGFNNLRTISSFTEVKCNIVKLVLRNNALTTLHGIEHLKSLEGLDLSYNIISNFLELEILAGLTLLQSLWLEGNPICCARWYRAQVFSLFTYPERLKLDDSGISTREFWKRQIIIASRQKLPSSFGFYSPVKDEAEHGGSITRKKRKQSRLAPIESEEESVCIFSDQDSSSSHNEIPIKQENARHDDEAEIVDLMNRVELLKKERSILWLREVKEWLDQAPEDTNSALNILKENNLQSRMNQKYFGESSKCICDPVEASGDKKNTTYLESEYSVADKAIPLRGSKYLDQMSAAGSTGGIPLPGIGRMDLKEQLELYSHKEIKTIPGHVKASNTIRAHKSYGLGVNPMESTFTATEDPTVSHSPSAHPGSPPHYQEDILHRRHNLVEEILQLSADSYSVASSDSDSSCSEDDLCEYGSSMSSVNYPSGRSFPRWIVDERFVGSSFKGKCYDMKGPIQQAGDNGNCLSDSLAEEAPKVLECSLQPNGFDSSVPNHDSNTAHLANQEASSLQKRRSKRKSVKRVISLSSENEASSKAGIPRQSSVDMDFDGLEDEQEKNNPRGQCSFSQSDEFIESYFKGSIAETRSRETIRHYLRCDCVLEQESIYREREVAVILTSDRRLYVLLIGIRLDGSGTILSVLGCHMIEDFREILVGIGLQVMRICIGGGPTYILIVRNMEKSRQLLEALQDIEIDSHKMACSLRSLEFIQVELFSKHICGGSQVNLFQYSMILFWHNSSKEKSWSNRSLFVTRRFLLVCVEDIRKISSLSKKAQSAAYFSLVLCCNISDVSEMVIEEGENGSVSLELEHAASKFPHVADANKVATSASQDISSHTLTWKFKWSSEKNLLQFVTLLKALHSQTPSPLFVRYTP